MTKYLNSPVNDCVGVFNIPFERTIFDRTFYFYNNLKKHE